MTRAKRLLGNLFLLTLGTVVGLLFLEVAARVLVSARRPGKSGEQALYTDFDPVLGWRNRPGASLTYNRREYQTKVEINRLGFRDLERSVQKPPGKRRVLVLGDSFIEAYAVERDEGITRQTEMMAAAEGCPAEIVNAGVHGYSIAQEYLWYRNEGVSLDADVVIMAVYYNDIIQTVRPRYWGSPTPLLELRGADLVPVNTPLPAPAPRNPATPQARAIEGSALKSVILERLVTGAPRVYARLADLGLVDPYEPEAVPDELRVYRSRGAMPEIQAAWTKSSEILRAFANEVRRDGGVPVIAHIPAQFEVVDEAWELTLMVYGLNESAWSRSLVRDRLRAIASESGSHFLDFTTDLQNGVSTWKTPYYRNDGHWNPHGNAIAAKTAVAFLRQQGLLACAAKP